MMHTRRMLVGFGLAGVLSGTAAGEWVFGPPTLIHAYGDNPSLWNGTVAFVDTTSASIGFYDGSQVVPIYDSGTLYCFAPSNANGTVAWRTSMGSVNTNEIFYWTGGAVENLTNSPGVSDAEVSVGSNGDMIWSVQFGWLMYYDASEDRISPLNVRGRYPSLWIREDGTATYAFQDPDTFDVVYNYGSGSFVLGPGLGQGTDLKARPSLKDGFVAWIGPGVGDTFTAGELFVWDGVDVQRLTNDDAVGGRADDFPSVWRRTVVWQRAPNSATQTRIFFWDGEVIRQLTNTRTSSPSFNHGQLAWVDWSSGLYIATLAPPMEPGDCDNDGEYTAADAEAVLSCLGGPEIPITSECACGDFDQDSDADMHDLAQFAPVFVSNVAEQ